MERVAEAVEEEEEAEEEEEEEEEEAKGHYAYEKRSVGRLDRVTSSYAILIVNRLRTKEAKGKKNGGSKRIAKSYIEQSIDR